jgi:Kef-type K+ transport system membrane component KefB/mannitol/fructose-specific phosphotransferase system IIA component (Ntr-type)
VETLNAHQVLVMLLSFGVLLGLARLLGELALKLHQPAVLGELLAGVLLGPTVFGALAPLAQGWLFPAAGPNALALNAISTLAVVLFLLVAGMEVDLSILWRQGRIAPKVSLTGILIPFAIGFPLAWWIPEALGQHAHSDPLLFALFFATALSISALPVIAKTLLDLGLYRSDLGMVVISAAIFDDISGWIIFSVILGMLNGSGHSLVGVPLVIGLTLGFTVFMLTLGRWSIHRALPYLQAYTRWPGGELSFALILALLGAAFTEWIGIHAIFGSFMVGVAVGDSFHVRERTRVIIDQFVSFIFAPVFFASIGLKVNFLVHFDLQLVLIVLAIACFCKLLGGYWGARWGGMPRKDSWAVGFAMNARGAMEIILGLLALEAGLIDQPLFVALIVMAMVTSMMSGPAMRMLIRRGKGRKLEDLLHPRLFIPRLSGTERRDVIAEMCFLAARHAGLDAEQVELEVWKREQTLPTGLGNRLAVPHARLDGLTRPIAVLALAPEGVDFDSPDGQPAKLLVLLLTPRDDAGVQLSILSELAHLFHDAEQVDRMLGAQTYTEVMALLKARPQQAGWV